MVDKVISFGSEVILVDTTGFVSGEAGRDLKRRKIDLVSPRFILALQKNEEIEPILEQYKESTLCKIYRVPLSDRVRSRSMEERRTNRTNKFRDYFRSSVIHELAMEEVRIEGEVLDPDGALLPMDWSLRINGLLIGLKDGNDDTLALGLIRNYVEENKVVRISTPLREMQRVRTLQLSSLRLVLLFEDEIS
jgi:polynucleotide 5'-hydroxyl-kinase GRC3/NOL9